ncbi:MAG: aminotransferase class I/II-fold pyridoxal phosphate-dependent enzyme, partial [Sulfurimicrobium sp.]|nr:aminotransferase class I/II-fold pyridoxal phosphate-dependent enzyme [Sulfurimicrobium sp.]
MTRRKSNLPDVHLNLNVRGLKQSATLAINERSGQLLQEGRQVFRLGLGQSRFPVPQPVVDELKANAHQKDYQPVRGLYALREAVAGYHRRMHGIDRTAADVLIGPGSKELMFILQLVYYGDLVIPTPSWVSYAPQAQIVGRQIRWVPTRLENDWRLMPEELDRLCKEDPGRPRIVILNYPSNPTGDSYTLDELKALAKVARKYKVILLSDEIYGELHHRGQHVSIARFYPEGTIISGGLSKWCGAGGWRLGTFVFPHSLRWLLDAMAEPRPRLATHKMPYPGESNLPRMELWVFDASGAKAAVQVQTQGWDHLGDLDMGAGGFWPSKDGRTLYFARMSRGYGTVELCAADVATGEV